MTEPRPTKRERTRRKLIDAGLQVIADRGEAVPKTAKFVPHGRPNLGAAIRKSATGGSAIAKLIARVDEKIPTDTIGLLETESPLYLMPFKIRS